ncbi:uncharacterized protein LOC131614346 [Vicia villosa]|uniref:uncharacterized protein LOC131614346 n=1 Tax=Vicia villosa TaxID=3911 RepID=UPI00273AF4E8|nr:uncharacterized protein LOC131614346 [Vicia villosa]
MHLVELGIVTFSVNTKWGWPKGSSPLTVLNLKNKLTNLWNSIGKWGVTSLGKGYFEFSFSSIEDVRRVRSISSWNLNSGFLKLFPWTKDFNPHFLKQASAQVWLRIHGLAQEYWRPKIVFAIASSVGIPLCTDSASNKCCFERPFGHYVRVLVDLDLSQELRYKVLVERKGYAFFVELEYENLPDYCSFCCQVGHGLEKCNRRNVEGNPDKKNNKKAYVQINNVSLKESGKEVRPEVDGELRDTTENANNVKDAAEKPGVKTDDRIAAGVVVTDVVEDTNLKEVSPAIVVEDGSGTSENSIEQYSNEEFVADTNPLLGEINRNMAFLDSSWANIAQAEAGRNGLGVDNTQVAVADDEGFQLVKSKSRKKAQHIQAARSNYITRSRPGSAQSSPL